MKKFLNKEKSDRERSQWQAFTYVSGIGIQAAVTIGVCIYLGRLADDFFQLGTICTVVGIIAGFATSVWSVYKAVRKI